MLQQKNVPFPSHTFHKKCEQERKKKRIAISFQNNKTSSILNF